MSKSDGFTSNDADEFLKRSILSKLDKAALQAIRIAVKRRVLAAGPSGPLERSIDDPANIVPLVHIRNDCRKIRNPPIFGKEIKVNQENWDSHEVFNEKRSKTPSKNLRHSHQDKSRTRSRSRQKSRCRSGTREKEILKSSRRERGIFKNLSDDEQHKSCCVHYKNKKTSNSGERRKSKSPTPFRHKTRSSRSPSNSDTYRSRRSRTPPRYGKRRSRSPRHKSCSCSPSIRKYFGRRYSRSKSRTPTKYKDGDFAHDYGYFGHSNRCYFSDYELDEISKSRGRRKSKSPPLRSGEYRPRHKKRSSRSPVHRYPSKSDKYSSRRSRSPSRSGMRRSRSPPRKRTRSPRKRSRSRSPPRYRDVGFAHKYGYFGDNFWIPGPAFRPGLPPQYPGPTGFLPRGMVPGPIMFPRMPIMHPFGPFPRQPPPIYNSGAIRPKNNIQKNATITSEKSDSAAVQTEGESSQLIIQETPEAATSGLNQSCAPFPKPASPLYDTGPVKNTNNTQKNATVTIETSEKATVQTEDEGNRFTIQKIPETATSKSKNTNSKGKVLVPMFPRMPIMHPFILFPRQALPNCHHWSIKVINQSQNNATGIINTSETATAQTEGEGGRFTIQEIPGTSTSELEQEVEKKNPRSDNVS